MHIHITGKSLILRHRHTNTHKLIVQWSHTSISHRLMTGHPVLLRAQAVLGHGGSKLFRVLGLFQQGLAFQVEAICLFQLALAYLQDEVTKLWDL